MIIDDEKLQLTLRAALLEAFGYEVVAFQDGGRAIEAFLSKPFDLVITDLLMPAMTGLDIAYQLKSYNPSVPIILLTGWGRLLEGQDASCRNIDSILSKPCDATDLLAAVENLLNRPAGIEMVMAETEPVEVG